MDPSARAGPEGAAAPAELELLRELVAIPSPTGSEAAAVGWLARQAQGLGLGTRVDAAGNLIMEALPAPRLRSDPGLYLLGHIDTVPGFWPVREEAGRLWGRGASDAKGPLAAFICATLRAQSKGRLRRRVLILAAVGEEGDSAGARHLAARLPPPAYLLVGEPSGSHRLVIGYRGQLRCVASLTCEVRHGSRPEPTAGELGCELWAQVRRALDGRSAGRTGFEELTVHLLGIETSGDGLQERVSLRLGFRLPPSVGPKAVLATLSKLDPRPEVIVESCERAATVSRTGPLPTALARAIRAEGREPVWQRRLGSSDLNVVLPAWGSPAVVYGPGDAELDHTPRESISLHDYGRAIRVLAQVIGEL